MANHASAEKKIRKDEKRRQLNVSRVSRVRTFVKKAEESFRKGGTAEDSQAAFQKAQSELMRGVSKGVFHKKTAARKVSRLAARLKASVTGS